MDCLLQTLQISFQKLLRIPFGEIKNVRKIVLISLSLLRKEVGFVRRSTLGRPRASARPPPLRPRVQSIPAVGSCQIAPLLLPPSIRSASSRCSSLLFFARSLYPMDRSAAPPLLRSIQPYFFPSRSTRAPPPPPSISASLRQARRRSSSLTCGKPYPRAHLLLTTCRDAPRHCPRFPPIRRCALSVADLPLPPPSPLAPPQPSPSPITPSLIFRCLSWYSLLSHRGISKSLLPPTPSSPYGAARSPHPTAICGLRHCPISISVK